MSPAFSRLTGLTEQQILGAEEGAIEAMLRERVTTTATWRGFESMRRDLRDAAGEAQPRRELIDLARPKPRCWKRVCAWSDRRDSCRCCRCATRRTRTKSTR